MRSIETKENVEMKQKRSRMIFSYIILGILVISSMGYAFISSDFDKNKEEQSGEYGGRYYTTLNGQQLSFANSPESVKNISVNSYPSLNSYSGKTLYIVSGDNEVVYEIVASLGGYAERVQKACYLNCTEDLPEKDCNDNLIIVNLSESNVIYRENNCVFINGDMRAVDAFLYKVMGIA